MSEAYLEEYRDLSGTRGQRVSRGGVAAGPGGAVYRELDDADGFVVTAYLTRRLNRDREVLWSR